MEPLGDKSAIRVVHTGTTNNGKSMIVVIPKAIRDMLSLDKGRALAVSIEGEQRIIYDVLEERKRDLNTF